MGNENKNSTNKILNIIVALMVVFVSCFYAGYYAYQDYMVEYHKNNADYGPSGDYGVEE